MKPTALLIVALSAPSLAWAQGGAGGTGGVQGGAAGAAGIAASGGAASAASGVTSGGIGGRSGSRRDEGCTCRQASGQATGAWLLLAALAGGAWRRRASRRG